MKVLHILMILLIITISLYCYLILKENREGLTCSSSQLSLIEKVNNNSTQIYKNAKIIKGLHEFYNKSFPNKKTNDAIYKTNDGADKEMLSKFVSQFTIIKRINYNTKRINDTEQQIALFNTKLKLLNVEGMETLYTILNDDASDGMINIQVSENCSKINRHVSALNQLKQKISSKIIPFAKKIMKVMQPTHDMLMDDQDGDISLLNPDSHYNLLDVDNEGGILDDRASDASKLSKLNSVCGDKCISNSLQSIGCSNY